MKLPFSEMEKTKRSRSGGKIRISKLNTLSLRCPLNLQVEIGNRIDKPAGQERDYGRAKRTKTKSQASRLATVQKGLFPWVGEVKYLRSKPRAQGRKYGNPARTPPPSVVPTIKQEQVRERGWLSWGS